MLSSALDSMGLFRGMHDILITSIPVNPFDIIAENRWQISTYKIFSQIMGMSNEHIKEQISPRAFSFYSFTNKTFFIVYNSDKQPDKIRFHLSHEIGHILYGHVSSSIPVMGPMDKNKLERDALADQFARFVLQLD